MKRIISVMLALVLLLTVIPMGSQAHAANSGKKLVAITFDDGPGKYTDYLVEELNKLDAKATFFMLGSRAQDYPNTLRKIYLSGHEIACHTWNHPNLRELSESQVLSQFSRTYDVLDRTCGEGTLYLTRAPYDSQGPRERRLIDSPFIVWSVDPMDWDVLNREKVKNRIVNSTEPGDIILVHDIYKTSVDGALDAIKILQKKGYEFVTVTELFRRHDVPLEHHKEYYSCKKNSDVDLGPVQSPSISYTCSNGKMVVSLEAQKGADIYYNLDGSGITNVKGTKYKGPFTVEPGETVYAMAAFDLNGSRSEMTHKTIEKFMDVPSNAWYAGKFDRAVNMGILNGYGNGVFKPDEDITRADFCTMLYRAAGKPDLEAKRHHFDDVSADAYFDDAIQWGYANGLLYGYTDHYFGAKDRISREQMCVILCRYLAKTGNRLPTGTGVINAFKDCGEAERYALRALDAMLEAELFYGVSDTELDPTGSSSRAQGVVMLIRVLDYITLRNH